MSLFDIDIQGIVSDSLSGQLYPATLTRVIPGEYDPITDTWTDEQTLEFHSEGIIETYSEEMRAAGLATEKDRKILLLAKPLGTDPKAGDTIEIEGQTLTVTGIPERDPASATWTVRGEL